MERDGGRNMEEGRDRKGGREGERKRTMEGGSDGGRDWRQKRKMGRVLLGAEKSKVPRNLGLISSLRR